LCTTDDFNRKNESVQITRARNYTKAVSARRILLQKFIFNAFFYHREICICIYEFLYTFNNDQTNTCVRSVISCRAFAHSPVLIWKLFCPDGKRKTRDKTKEGREKNYDFLKIFKIIFFSKRTSRKMFN